MKRLIVYLLIVLFLLAGFGILMFGVTILGEWILAGRFSDNALVGPRYGKMAAMIIGAFGAGMMQVFGLKLADKLGRSPHEVRRQIVLAWSAVNAGLALGAYLVLWLIFPGSMADRLAIVWLFFALGGFLRMGRMQKTWNRRRQRREMDEVYQQARERRAEISAESADRRAGYEEVWKQNRQLREQLREPGIAREARNALLKQMTENSRRVSASIGSDSAENAAAFASVNDEVQQARARIYGRQADQL